MAFPGPFGSLYLTLKCACSIPFCGTVIIFLVSLSENVQLVRFKIVLYKPLVVLDKQLCKVMPQGDSAAAFALIQDQDLLCAP